MADGRHYAALSSGLNFFENLGHEFKAMPVFPFDGSSPRSAFSRACSSDRYRLWSQACVLGQLKASSKLTLNHVLQRAQQGFNLGIVPRWLPRSFCVGIG